MKKLFSVVLCVILVFSSLTFVGFTASAATYSGTCGTSLTWSLDTSTGVLNITGSGDMTSYSYSSAPWYSYRSYVKTVTIGNNVTSIGSYAFYSCDSLESVTIPNSVTTIGSDAFYSCDSLESVTIPNSVTSIGSYAFAYCYSLKSVTIGNSVTTIGSYAFYSCDSLESVTIPNSVTSIGNNAFYYCNSLTSITVNSGNQNFSSAEGVLFNKNKTTLIQYPIGNTRTSYTIPSTVTSIGISAFHYCDSLKSVTIPNSVTTIGSYAFYSCDSLKSVTIPNSVTTIGSYAFAYCYSLESVTIPNSVTSIGNNAFSSCDSVTNITVESGNQYYSSSEGVLFNKNKTTLIQCPIGNTRTSYTIPSTVTSIGDSAFYYCDSLKSVTIPNSVTTIGSYAFYSCDSLESVTIPNSVTSIGIYAFCSCDSLESVTIPNSVTSIGYSAFEYCESLTSVTIPNSVTSIGDSAFYSCYSLESVTIPNSVTSIGSEAFFSCESLTSVTIGNGVTTIGSYAFYSCDSLESVTIPNSVTTIGSYAFYSCDSLEDVYYNGSEDEWDEITINSGNTPLTNATIHYNYDVSATYTLTYNANGGSGAPSSQSGATSYIISSTIPTRSGYTFLGWSTSSTATTVSYKSGDTITLFANTTLYAVWEVNLPVLTENSTNSVTISTGGTVKNYTFTPTTSGTYVIYSTGSADTYVSLYNSSGGLLDSDDDYGDDNNFRLQYNLTAGTTYKYGIKYYSSSTTGTISFKFNRIYTISYNANGGSGAPSSQTKEYGTSITLSSTKPTRSGYKFLGWSTSSSATTASYKSGATFSTNANTTLYAVWHKHSYVKTVTTQSTCSTIGAMLYSCSCGDAYFEDIAKKNHTTVIDKGTPATCSKAGVSEGSHCSVCGLVLKAQTPIGMKSHTIVVDKGTPATCLKSGMTDYSHCSVCGFVLKAQTPIKIKNHEGVYVVKKPTYFEKGFLKKICKNCKIPLGYDSKNELILKTPKFELIKGKKQFKIKYTKVVDASGFEIRYKIGKGDWVTKTFSTKKTVTKVIKKLKKGTYDVQVRALIKQGGKTAYSAWNKTKKVKVK